MPFQPPLNVLNRPFLTAFNAAYRWKKGRSPKPRQVGYQGFFFPLDGLGDWNRLYGPKGLFQYRSAAACAITAASGRNAASSAAERELPADSGLLPDTGLQSLHEPLGSPGMEAAGKVAITAGGVAVSLRGGRVNPPLEWGIFRMA